MAAVKPEYILAVDYGEKRVGIAIAHEIARLPRPLTTVQHTSQLVEEIRAIVEREAVKLVLVGLPRGMDGGYTAQTRAAEEFQKRLAAELPVPVRAADETLTSVDAEATLAGTSYRKGEVDALAASYILERYLNEYHTTEGK